MLKAHLKPLTPYEGASSKKKQGTLRRTLKRGYVTPLNSHVIEENRHQNYVVNNEMFQRSLMASKRTFYA